MNSIWNKNYKAFTNRFPQLAQMLPPPDLNMVASPVFWNIMAAKNGMITGEENGLRLHSGYNPEREAITGVSNKEIIEKSATVFYGFGLGYHVVQWAKMILDQGLKDKKLILIEPDFNHFYCALGILDWTQVFQLENLILAIGCPVESVLPLIEDTRKINIGNSGVSDAFFFNIPAFRAHNEDYFASLESIIKRNQRKNEINSATLKKFGKLWCRNSLRNIHWMKELASLESLKNHIPENIPYLIIGAGPSLENILPYIKELSKRTIIICVETALRALLQADVQPDFIIITDPQWWAYKHIAGLKAPESILVTEISAYPAVFRFPCKKIVLCNSQFCIGQYFQEKLGLDFGDLGSGGSVASAAWNMAYLLGGKKIFMAGVDFGFPNNKPHMKGSDAEDHFLEIENRIETADKFISAGLFNANKQIGKDFNGTPIVTDSRMKMFSWWFESRLAGCTDCQTFTLCPEGLYTPGIGVALVDQVLEGAVLEKGHGFGSDVKEAGVGEIGVTGDKVPRFKKMVREFPDEEFFGEFPFLKEYL